MEIAGAWAALRRLTGKVAARCRTRLERRNWRFPLWDAEELGLVPSAEETDGPAVAI